jgi:predicted CXXCH cytochrome family protein
LQFFHITKARLVQMHRLAMVPTSSSRMLQVRKNFRRKTLPHFLVLLAFLFVIAVMPALAKTHPVPLDKNVDSAKCLECHEDKSKGKAVHSAIAMGCLTCHEVRVNKDVTRIKLITAAPYTLCLNCHADKNAAELKGTVHPPAIRDCLKCHDPHTSDNKNQLLKPLSGDAKENLCLSCHKTGENVPANGSRHAALDMGCDSCHATHKTGETGKAEFDFHLTKGTPALCLDCHDGKSADLQKAHHDQPFATADCTSCHDPHQSASPKLMRQFLHPPFADKSCDMCHAPAKNGKVVLTQTDVKSLCVTCHDDKAKLIDSAKVQHPGAAGDCTDCHNPHASRQPGLPKTNAVDICLGCHTDQAEQAKKHVLHQPAFKQGCATCHEPHGGENDHLLRVKGNALCLECHGADSVPQKMEAQHLVAIFNGQVKLPDDYYKKNGVVILGLRYGLGHPVAGHPVGDVMDPADITKVRTHLGCLSCHQPHSSAKPALLVKDQQNDMAFCDTCHKNRINMRDVKTGN